MATSGFGKATPASGQHPHKPRRVLPPLRFLEVEVAPPHGCKEVLDAFDGEPAGPTCPAAATTATPDDPRCLPTRWGWCCGDPQPAVSDAVRGACGPPPAVNHMPQGIVLMSVWHRPLRVLCPHMAHAHSLPWLMAFWPAGLLACADARRRRPAAWPPLLPC